MGPEKVMILRKLVILPGNIAKASGTPQNPRWMRYRQIFFGIAIEQFLCGPRESSGPASWCYDYENRNLRQKNRKIRLSAGFCSGFVHAPCFWRVHFSCVGCREPIEKIPDYNLGNIRDRYNDVITGNDVIKYKKTPHFTISFIENVDMGTVRLKMFPRIPSWVFFWHVTLYGLLIG